MLRSLGADLMAEIPPGERYAEAARGWLDGVLTEVFPELLEGLRTRPASRAVTANNDHLPWGQPGQVRGTLRMGLTNPVPRRAAMYTDAAWQRMLASLGKSPVAVAVDIHVLGQDGFPEHRASGSAQIDIKRWPTEPDWVRFTFSAHAMGTCWPDSPELQDRWARFVRRQAVRIGACVGFMTDDRLPGSQTALEQTVLTDVYPYRRREVLYGYSWITLVPLELAARLGGAPGLTSSGAFCEVSELPDGSVWLRATPTINEFTGDRVRGVFETLAPVLLTGRTEFTFGYKDQIPRLVEGVDAADYQRPVPPGDRRLSGRGSGSDHRPSGSAHRQDRTAASAGPTGGDSGMPRALERLPGVLPPGRLVVPDPSFANGDPVTGPVLWVSDEPIPDAGLLWTRLLAEHPRTGLWPLLLAAALDPAAVLDLEATGDQSGRSPQVGLAARPWQTGELAPVPADLVDEADAETVLATGWHQLAGEGLYLADDGVPGLPFATWPGLAEAAASDVDPDQHAAALASAAVGISRLVVGGAAPYMGLVAAPDGAAAIAACGWLSPADGPAQAGSVVRSWQHRFGARLCSLGIDTVVLSVAWPPATIHQARRVAAEHFAFCNDLADMAPFDEYAEQLTSAPTWAFWWD